MSNLLTYHEYPEPLKKRADAISDEKIAEALTKNHGLQYLTARSLECSAGLISGRIKESSYLQEIRRDAIETRLDYTEEALDKAILNGNLTAIIFTLKTLGRSRGYGQDSVIVSSRDEIIRELLDQIPCSTNLVNDR